jgi:superfamily II DNA or RNA helicase
MGSVVNQKRSSYILDGYFRIPADDPAVSELIETLTLDVREGTFALYEKDEELNELCIPRTFRNDVLFRSRSIEDCTVGGRPFSWIDDPSKASHFIPREGQLEVVQGVCDNLFSNYGSLLIAGCGTGKTVMGAEIALRMGVSTCVIVHKEFLASQWEAAFAMLAPWVTVGRMQRDQVDTGHNFDIVLAVTQSIVNPKRDYSDDFYNSFGLIICDEVHRYGASIWQKAITKFPARYRVGLTATPERQDGLWRVITSHISNTGPTLKAASLVPDIYIVKTDVKVDQKLWYKPWLDLKLQRGAIISALSGHRGRNEAILSFILKAYNKGRKVLVISERRAQLDHFSKRLTEESISCDDIGFYVGGMKQDKLDISARKQVILTTYQMSKEGLDIPDLDTLIMATPQGSIEQTVGRILRRFEGKATPVVIDVHDDKFEAVINYKDLDRTEDELFKPLISGLFSRKRQYKKLGYRIHG